MTPSAQSKDSDDVPQMTETVAVKELRDGNESPEIISAFANWSRSACIKTFWRLYLTGLLVSTGGMYVGYLVSAVGNIIANQGFIDAFATVTDPQTGKPALDANHVALWGAINFAAQIFIQMIAPFTADRWGRKFNMWLLTFFLSVSIVLSIVAKNWIVYTIAKMFGGFAAGLLGSSIMIYMSEITMPQFRGALLSSFSLMFSLGQVFLAVGLKILQETDMLKFRNIFYSEFVFCGLWLFPMIYLPETPVWLAGQGKHDQGKRALRRLVGNVDGFDIDHEYAVIEQEVEASVKLSKLQNNTDNAWKAFLSRKNMKRTIVAALPLTFQNFVGVPLVFGYSTYFFSLAQVQDPFTGSIIIQVILVIGVVAGFYLIDKVGRRSLVLYGGGAMGVLTTIIGGLGFMKQNSASGAALVALCAIWTFVYAISLAPIGWVSLVEVSTPMLRAKTTAVASIIQSCTGVLFSYTVPIMLSNQGAGWGQKIGLFFGGITFAYLILCILLFPETQGRTYGELDELFDRNVPAWKFAKTTTVHQGNMENQQQVN